MLHVVSKTEYMLLDTIYILMCSNEFSECKLMKVKMHLVD